MRNSSGTSTYPYKRVGVETTAIFDMLKSGAEIGLLSGLPG